MKFLVIEVTGADPELLFGDEQMSNVGRLMEFGCFGPLEDELRPTAPWEQLVEAGLQSVLIGVTPPPPSRAIPGIRIAWRRPDDSDTTIYTQPASIQAELVDVLGAYPVAVEAGYNTDRADAIAAQQSQHDAVRYVLERYSWEYAYILMRAQPALAGPDDAYEENTRSYYHQLDAGIGQLFEVLDENTAVLVLGWPDEAPTRSRFALAAPYTQLSGEITGASVADIAVTLLDLGGYMIPAALRGTSLAAGQSAVRADDDMGLSPDEEELLRERLSGLGYIS